MTQSTRLCTDLTADLRKSVFICVICDEAAFVERYVRENRKTLTAGSRTYGTLPAYRRTRQEALVDIKVLDTSHGPVYEQIRNQIAELIASGTLACGAELPRPPALAQQCNVDRGEVSRAYFELEQQELIVVKKSKNFLGETMTSYIVR
jgi:hypothetical protein